MILPLKFKAVSLPDYNSNLIRAILSFKIEEREITEILNDEVIIEVHASPINPSDIAFIRGGYNIKKTLPATPGFETSGIVILAGSKFSHLVGNKVACFTQDDFSGCWAEYLKTKGNNCISLIDDIDMDQAACLSINPLTALGLLDLCLSGNYKGIILSAAGGRVADFVRIMAQNQGFKTINLVRSAEKAVNLSNSIDSNFHQVLNDQDEFFWDKLKIQLNDSEPWIAFDAVGGDFSGKLFNSLPNNSKLVLYGALSEGEIKGIDALDLIFNNKSIEGFNLNNWVGNRKQNNDFDKVVESLQQMIVSQSLMTPIVKTYSLSEVSVAIRDYIKNMSEGKILIKP